MTIRLRCERQTTVHSRAACLGDALKAIPGFVAFATHQVCVSDSGSDCEDGPAYLDVFALVFDLERGDMRLLAFLNTYESQGLKQCFVNRICGQLWETIPRHVASYFDPDDENAQRAIATLNENEDISRECARLQLQEDLDKDQQSKNAVFASEKTPCAPYFLI
jgi:hypothetical protein